jgi:hypothetical protein
MNKTGGFGIDQAAGGLAGDICMGEWLVRHHGPPRLGDCIHDWLTQDALFADVRWQTKEEWTANGPSKAMPW